MVWLIFVIPLVLVLVYAFYHDFKQKSFTERNPSENVDYAYAHSMAERGRNSDTGGGGGF